MKYYKITLSEKGKKREEGIYAKDKKDAQKKAKKIPKVIVIKVVESTPPIGEVIKNNVLGLIQTIRQKKINPDSLIAAIRQLAVMTNAGISIHEALIEIANSSDNERLQTILLTISDDINSGHSLSASCAKFKIDLGNLTIAMIELGEQTGNMAESLYSLADMLEEIRANVIKFKKAMAYPRNVMIAMAVAFTILISYVVPQFKTIFEELGADLPAPTLILLWLENVFNNYGPYVLAGGFVLIATLKYFINTNDDVKYKFHELLLKTYLIKNIIHFATLNRFTLVFAELVHAGIPIVDALKTSINMLDSLPLKRKLSTVSFKVEKGGSLVDGLRETKLFENMILQMLAAGESSGQLDNMLKNVTDYYKMKFDAIIDGLSEAVEPIMLFVIASMVILLALGIFLPMWSMGDAVQGR